MYVQV